MLTYNVERVALADAAEIDLNAFVLELNARRCRIEREFVAPNQRHRVLDLVVGWQTPLPLQKAPTPRQWTTRDIKRTLRLIVYFLAERQKFEKRSIHTNSARRSIPIEQAQSALFLEDRQLILNLFDLLQRFTRDRNPTLSRHRKLHFKSARHRLSIDVQPTLFPLRDSTLAQTQKCTSGCLKHLTRLCAHG